jgi:hypothetical protein
MSSPRLANVGNKVMNDQIGRDTNANHEHVSPYSTLHSLNPLNSLEALVQRYEELSFLVRWDAH